ncbi:MAG: restriction endonuclease [Oceanospirillales bacterium]|nr:restriction endonuclease [Oceanospirillales bacterium]MBR9887180.1 restriction endonuclease [Oceanospirillales bacterium]
MHTVIVENDQSQWSDSTGIRYHFPKRYLKYLQPGTQVIYYKGRMRDKSFTDARLSSHPHYFATAIINEVYVDKQSPKGDLFAVIGGYRAFNDPVLSKIDNTYLEAIPDNRKSNYWRDGVRPISHEIYEAITSKVASFTDISFQSDDDTPDVIPNFESAVEGNKKQLFVTTYERDPKLRKQAIAIHGVTCKGCNINFGKKYGPYAEGFIHIHHIIPISELGEAKQVNPETDLIPLCANCHAIIHRRRDKTLSVEELREMINLHKNTAVATSNE